MNLEDLIPGTRLDVIREAKNKDNGTTVIGQSYTSALYSVLDAHTIEITAPQQKTSYVMLPPGDGYRFIFTTDRGLLRSKGAVLENYRNDNFRLCRVELEGELTKYQRREFYRMDCMLPVAYTELAIEEAAMDPEEIRRTHASDGQAHPLRQGTAIDISGGGIRFTSDKSLSEVPAVLLSFTLPFRAGDAECLVKGRIVRSDHIQGADRYSHRVQFMDLPMKKQEEIVRFVFETERLRRQKEQ